MNKNWIKTTEKTRIWINDKIETLNVYEVPIEDLFLYPQNTRFSLQAQEAGIDKKNTFERETQDALEELIWNKYKKQNQETLESLEKSGLKDPIYVYRDGTVLSGNRRTMLMKRINRNDKTKFNTVNAVVHDGNLTEVEKKSYELMLQYEPQEKVKYTRVNRMFSSSEVYNELKDTLTETEIAKKLGYGNKTKLIKDLNEFNLLKEFINYYNKDIMDSKYHKKIADYDGDNILNVLDTLHNITSNKNLNKIQIEKAKIAMFNLIILDNIRSLDIRTAFNSAYRDIDGDFYKSFHKDIEDNITNSILQEIKTEKQNSDEVERSRKNLRYSFMKISAENIEYKTTSAGIKEIDEYIDKAILLLDSIEKNKISTKSSGDMKKIEKKVKKMLTLIKQKI